MLNSASVSADHDTLLVLVAFCDEYLIAFCDGNFSSVCFFEWLQLRILAVSYCEPFDGSGDISHSYQLLSAIVTNSSSRMSMFSILCSFLSRMDVGVGCGMCVAMAFSLARELALTKNNEGDFVVINLFQGLLGHPLNEHLSSPPSKNTVGTG